jgi:hypothetical protein
MNEEPEKPLSVVESIVRDINYSYGKPSGPSVPSKKVDGVDIRDARYDEDRLSFVATLSVLYEWQSPWGDTGNSKNDYTVTTADLDALRRTNVDYRHTIELAWQKLERQEAALHDDWIKAGMPARAPVQTMPTLRLKPKPAP